MASNKTLGKEMSFTWGETVRVKVTAPSDFRPGKIGEICGISGNVALGEKKLYLVEFGDGNSLEIPENFLERVES